MMEAKDILNPEALTLFLYFVVPGFVAIQVYDAIVPSERRNFGESVIQVVSYSLITNVLLFWTFPILSAINAPAFRSAQAWAYVLGNAVFIALSVFLVPSALALAVYNSRTGRSGFFNRVLRRFGVQHVALDPMPTAWDKFFSRRDPCFIIFHMKNGDLIAGAFSTKSFASAYPAEQQVYVEQLLTIDKGTKTLGLMDHPLGQAGVIIKFEDCDYIETIV